MRCISVHVYNFLLRSYLLYKNILCNVIFNGAVAISSSNIIKCETGLKLKSEQIRKLICRTYLRFLFYKITSFSLSILEVFHHID